MPPRANTFPPPLTRAEFAALAAYRHALRRFLHFSTEVVRAGGLTQQQYQVLLAVKAAPATMLTIGELAATMQLRHHSTVGLVDRLARRQWLRRVRDPADGRRVRAQLTASGARVLKRLAALHYRELRQLGPELVRALHSLGAG